MIANRSYPLDDAIMAYLEADIAEHGGTGRRLSKIRLRMDWPADFPSDEEFGQAVRRLELAGRITIDEHEWIGFVYAVPTAKGK